MRVATCAIAVGTAAALVATADAVVILSHVERYDGSRNKRGKVAAAPGVAPSLPLLFLSGAGGACVCVLVWPRSSSCLVSSRHSQDKEGGQAVAVVVIRKLENKKRRPR